MYMEDLVVIRRRTRLDEHGQTERYWQLCSNISDADAVVGLLYRAISMSDTGFFFNREIDVTGVPVLAFEDEPGFEEMLRGEEGMDDDDGPDSDDQEYPIG